MNRKSIFLVGGIILLGLAGVAATLALLVLHEPDHYQRAAVPAGESRAHGSREFVKEFIDMVNFFTGSKRNLDDKVLGPDPEPHEPIWKFTQEQINSYLEEGFVSSRMARALPERISDPRVAIEADRLRLSFRYGARPWSTIVSINVRFWLVAEEPNVVALKIDGLRAGLLPISSQSILDGLSEVARGQNVDVTWYRHQGRPVALLRFPMGSDSAVLLRYLQLQDNMIVVGGGRPGQEPITEPKAEEKSTE